MFGNTRTLKLQVEEPFTNRSRLGIIYHILMICNDEQVSQTRLMYKANLSYFQLKKYVNTLMVKGLLQETIQDEKKSYRSTPRGRQFIDAFRDLTRLLGNSMH
ncbi:MAG: winged helix-turn-helix domain-containing protein [Candidatus Bathyarchaeota archaeon]|nr:winged helix-turn-helix domain-containing protein [Candidatus Bathyarchaeota archaeon]